MAHGQVIYHPTVEKIFRFVLWLTNGVANNFQTAAHLQHHKFSDRLGDPYSVHIHGWWKRAIVNPVKATLSVLFWLPNSKDAAEDYPKRWGIAWPVDYAVKYPRLGRFIFLIINVIFFGWIGAVLWLVFNILARILIVTFPDILYHVVGYRNFKTKDQSRNLPGYLTLYLWAGENLHHNHHRYPGRVNFAINPKEFDLGYFYIRLLCRANLATIKS